MAGTVSTSFAMYLTRYLDLNAGPLKLMCSYDYEAIMLVLVDPEKKRTKIATQWDLRLCLLTHRLIFFS